MNCIDVFNGDADGICALHQLRLQTPRPEARLITGVKRDIGLLARIGDTSGSSITVLDISLDRNRTALEQLLAQENHIFYADHHYSGDIPDSRFLEAHIDPSPRLCTSLIVDQLLDGRFRPWAIVGAFGDNLDEVATRHGQELGLNSSERQALREIGLLLNYNGYGFAIEDLLVHPADLFTEVHRYVDPFSFSRESSALLDLKRGYEHDMAQAANLSPYKTYAAGRVFRLPEAAWSRRVVGVLANQLARDQPDLAHAVVIANPDGSLMISVRAPLATRKGADSLCRQFATGGGRAAAAGINALPGEELDGFLAVFADHYFQ